MSIFRSKIRGFEGAYFLSAHTAYVVYSFVILLVQGLWIVNSSIQPTLMKYGEVETHKMATAVMTKAVKIELMRDSMSIH